MHNIVAKYRVASYITMAVVIFFCVNIISNMLLARFELDLTESGLYTISKASKNILDNMEEPVVLHYFYSNKTANGVPLLKSYASRIRGLLEDYVRYSNGKITLKIIDPEPFSEEEELAESFGMQGLTIDDKGTKAYIGLAATNSVDQSRTIPFFALEREKFLEYEVTRAIYDLNNPKRKKVGVLSSIKLGSGPMLGLDVLGKGRDWLIIDQMKKVFDVSTLEEGVTVIPKDIDVLMVVQPKNFTNNTLYAIDQFILAGGNAVIFVDPHKEGGGTGNPADRVYSTNFKRLLRAWGVDIEQNMVVADRIAARKYNKSKNAKEIWNKVDYLAWLNLRDNNLNREDVTTSLLKSINMNTVGFIEDLAVADVAMEPLIVSNKESSAISAADVGIKRNPAKILREFKADDNEYVLAARITGKVRSAFYEYANIVGHIARARKPANIVLVADTDILRNDNWAKTKKYDNYAIVTTIADNAAFITNVIDNLSGGSQLMAVRGRGQLKRPFTKVEQLRRDAEESYLQKEEELKNKLASTEKRLSELQSRARVETHKSFLYKQQQDQEIKRFSAEMAKYKKEIRMVKGELRKDIESLGGILKFFNIWLMPMLVIALAVFVFFYKKSKMQRIYNS